MATKRLVKEFADLESNPPEFCTVGIDDVYNWSVTLFGPANTPYEGGCFQVKFVFPDTYPFKPPKVQFLTKIFHPNINAEGGICLSVLKDDWKPSVSVRKLLELIQSLLASPNPKDPLDLDIAHLYATNLQEFERTAREYTRTYA